ncbi:efflux RND transporter periplasmic adaptor subunit [Solilutibacter silvestris]|uniref:efflux RND transporter periplasmic adaptor subunit n=1 Tax=Solilutibacter silvestris TaxID=1645665 RepID=UPI003D348372
MSISPRFRPTAPLLRTALAVACAALLLAPVAGCKKQGGPGDAQAATKDGKGGKDGKNNDAVSVEVTPVSVREMTASFSGTAPLDARGDAQVVAKTSGIAERVFAEEGQHVREGQVLVQIDSAQQALRVQQTSAQAEKLARNLARSEELAKQKMVSANDVEQLRFDLQNARAQLNLAKLDLSYTRVTAPISGVIAQRSIKAGNLVQISTPIFRIVENDRLEATLNVPERSLEAIRNGLPVSMTVDAVPGKTFEGKVTRISPVVDSGSGTFRVICAFDGGGVLQPGMFGRIAVVFDRRAGALAIPRIAMLEDDNQAAVFTVRDGKAARVPIKTGYVDGEWVEVLSGLKSGDPVVTAGKAALRDGVAVQVINGKAAAAPAQVAKTP